MSTTAEGDSTEATVLDVGRIPEWCFQKEKLTYRAKEERKKHVVQVSL